MIKKIGLGFLSVVALLLFAWFAFGGGVMFAKHLTGIGHSSDRSVLLTTDEEGNTVNYYEYMKQKNEQGLKIKETEGESKHD